MRKIRKPKAFNDPKTGLRDYIPHDPGLEPLLVRLVWWVCDRVQDAKQELYDQMEQR